MCISLFTFQLLLLPRIYHYWILVQLYPISYSKGFLRANLSYCKLIYQQIFPQERYFGDGVGNKVIVIIIFAHIFFTST